MDDGFGGRAPWSRKLCFRVQVKDIGGSKGMYGFAVAMAFDPLQTG